MSSLLFEVCIGKIVFPLKKSLVGFTSAANTVRKWIRNPELPVAVNRRPKSPGRMFLEANRDVIKSEFVSCEMLCLPLRRRLLEKYQIEVPLRTLELFCKPFRDTVKLPDKAFGRFESLPGDQMQVDFGTKRLTIGDEEMDIHVFVAKLGYSRRIFAKAFFGESFAEWATVSNRRSLSLAVVPTILGVTTRLR